MRWTVTCEMCEWVRTSRHIFWGNAKLTAEERQKLYLYYNEAFSDSRRPSGCGACQRNVINGLKKVYEKYCEELCQ